MADATPWAVMLRTAMSFGVPPDRFWRLSMMEWRMLTETEAGVSPMRRAQLEQLMAASPDGGER